MSWQEAERVMAAWRKKRGMRPSVSVSSIAKTLGVSEQEIQQLRSEIRQTQPKKRFSDRSGYLSMGLGGAVVAAAACVLWALGVVPTASFHRGGFTASVRMPIRVQEIAPRSPSLAPLAQLSPADSVSGTGTKAPTVQIIQVKGASSEEVIAFTSDSALAIAEPACGS